ncbi:MAG TPA: outer membrane lipid asymmetry maintenance protein MlaD [Desulfomicrobiaceae bacterium]|nr:outer membrane lipid asymmetry maintenance protein MlaD [Desulfomicrobiaceae bacterium]
MKKYSQETTVGIFVFLGLLCVAYLTVKLGQMELMGGNSYQLRASFTSVSGLRSGSAVEMAGVQVGKVVAISFDQETMRAQVVMQIDNGINVDDESIASVKTSGLIGDKYIKISRGGSDFLLSPGETIIDTEGAIDLEELISKYIFGDV